MKQALEAALRVVRERSPNAAPGMGIVLGSGLADLAQALESPARIPYADIPGLSATSVAGHRGELVQGRLEGAEVACLSGRLHLYEGHPAERVVLGVRLLAALGCRAVIITNAAGGLRPDLVPGSLLLVRDHINLTGSNPLVGPTDSALPRFPDMTAAYDPRLREIALAAAAVQGTALAEGVYAGVLGPSYETPAEVRMLAALGADVVGMSTVHEVIALRQLGVRVAALSVVTNLAAGLSDRELDHEDVQAAGRAASARLMALVRGIVGRARPELSS